MDKKSKLLIAAFFALLLLIVLRTFRDYGITWDETFHRSYGDFIIRWYQSFFKDTAATQHPFLIYYGGFFDVLVRLADFLSPWGHFETRHLLGALFGLGTIFIAFKIAQQIAGYLAGFFAALFLTLQPTFYGHMFNNPVDIPFAALLLTTIYSFISTYDALPRLSPRHLFKIGLPLGLALAIRPGGMLIALPYMITCWFLWWGCQGGQTRELPALTSRKIILGFIQNFTWILVIAWLIMLACWPWAQLDPILAPLKAILFTLKWDFYKDMPVLFDGVYYTPFTVPRSYLLRSIMVTLPEFYLISLFIGSILALFSLKKKQPWTPAAAKIGFICFTFAFPLSAAALLKTSQFDTYRHFLFLIPLLAILSGISAAAVFRSGMKRWIKTLTGLAVIFSLSLTVLDMHRLHPYETVYFNRVQAGGLTEAAQKYETDYWGNSYREGILWVIKNYHPDLKRKIWVMNASEPTQVSYYLEKTSKLRDRFEMVQTDPDIFLSTTRGGLHRSFPGRVLYVVERDRTPLLYVIEVSKKQT